MSHTGPKSQIALMSGPLAGKVSVPGDKSISHRALILGALSTGTTQITGLLEADDVLNTARALTALGAPVTRTGACWQVLGRGVGGLRQPDGALDFGNSGTGARLMMGVLTGHPITVEIRGDASLSNRPMDRVLGPLMEMGLDVHAVGEGEGADAQRNRQTLPLMLSGLSDPIPITYELPVPSAQVKTAVLLAGLHAAGTTSVIERQPTRDHTERMMKYFGAKLDVARADGLTRIAVHGHAELKGRDIKVPGDPSSAAFLVAAALIVPGSSITILNVLINKTRIGFYETLVEMGGDITFLNEREEAGEPVADIFVRASPLTGVVVHAARAPSMIDEYPVLAVAAAFASGTTRMEGLAELKVKESDRLGATAVGLSVNGVECEIDGDCLIVHGGGGHVTGGGRVATHLDHRIAMAFLVMGLASNNGVTIDDTLMIATSFPGFLDLIENIGGRLEPPGPGPTTKTRSNG